jgi:sugar phosphate isomerase/epimerase
MLLGLAPGAGFAVRDRADLDTYLGAVADAGFAAVSLGRDQLVDDPVGAAKLVQRHGLRCTDVLALQVTRDDAATLADAAAMRLAVEALGAGAVLTLMRTRCTPESLDRLGRVSDLLGVPLALEFASGPIATMADAVAVIDEVGAARMLALADTFHFFRSGSTWPMLESVPPDHLSIVQFNDALPAESDDYMLETTNRRAWPGDGELPLERFAATLRRRGWDGVVSVEVLSADLRQLSMAEFARRAYETTAPFWS